MSSPLTSLASLLTDAERRILLLVKEGHRGKEIAPLVGTSYGMVEKHIRTAREKLGGVTRMQAARIAAAGEPDVPVQNLDLQKTDLSTPITSPAEKADDRGDAQAGVPERAFPWPFPSVERPTNELSFVQRWGWILVLSVAFALLTAGLLTTTGSLLDYLSRHYVPDRKTEHR